MRHAELDNPTLSIVIAVVSGREALNRCLARLYDQARENAAEIIVPYDDLTKDVLNLKINFPEVQFVEAPFSIAARQTESSVTEHARYDIRRATGLANSRGHLIALTEDHAVPAENWCEQIIRSHDEHKDALVIGGTIENEVDRSINWAWYYCDFGRYGRPVVAQTVDYVSDVNVSYKREAIMSARALWESGFHETTVHWSLARSGKKLFLDDRLVVFQHRVDMSLDRALKERVEWGKAFAATRAAEIGRMNRALLFLGCILLPFLLLYRAIRNMRRQGKPLSLVVRLIPLVFTFLLFWSIGEAIGYLTHSSSRDAASGSLETSISRTL